MDDQSTQRHTSGRFFTACIALSVLGHVASITVIERFGNYDFSTPITLPAAVMVDLSSPKQPTTTVTTSLKKELAETSHTLHSVKVSTPDRLNSPAVTKSATSFAKHDQAVKESQVASGNTNKIADTKPTSINSPQVISPIHKIPGTDTTYILSNSIVPVQRELLTYQVSLAGIPIGTAQLDASNIHGEVRIQTQIKSKNLIGAIYTVNDRTDTRLIKGRYLLTRIRQHEGRHNSDTGFTIMYPEKKVFWVDHIKKRSSNEPLDDMNMLDFVSGFYFLRQRALSVGDNFTIKLYDGDAAVIVPISVLKLEHVSLPGFRSAETIAIKPDFPASGFFTNNRDLLVWLTNDKYRTPVRIEATIPLGRVVAELISSERQELP